MSTFSYRSLLPSIAILMTLATALPASALKSREDVQACVKAVYNVDTESNPIEKIEKITEIYKDSKHDSTETYHEESSGTFKGFAKLVSDHYEGFLAKVMMYRRAKQTIDQTTYIFTRKTVALAVIKEHQEALKRGVNVRLMVDSDGSLAAAMQFHTELKALMAMEGGIMHDEDGGIIYTTDPKTGEKVPQRAKAELVVFQSMMSPEIYAKALVSKTLGGIPFINGDVPEFKYWWDRRSHDKILIIDRDSRKNAMAMFGGRNIDNHYYGIQVPENVTFNDNEVIVAEDPSQPGDANILNTFGAHYDRLINHRANRSLNNRLFGYGRKYGSLQKDIESAWASILDPEKGVLASKMKQMEDGDYLNRYKAGNRWHDGEITPLNQIENLSRHDAIDNPDWTTNPMNRQNGDSIYDHTTEAILEAKKSADIVSPYFMGLDKAESPKNLVKDVYATLMKLREKLDNEPDFKLRIALNSVASTDNQMAQAIVDLIVVPFFLPNAPGVSQTYLPKELQGWQPKYPQNIELYQMGMNQGKLHEKSLAIDSIDTFMLTYNFDVRSGRLNSELGARIRSQGLTQDQTDHFNTLITMKMVKVGSPEWLKLREDPSNVKKVQQQHDILETLRKSDMEYSI